MSGSFKLSWIDFSEQKSFQCAVQVKFRRVKPGKKVRRIHVLIQVAPVLSRFPW